MVYEARQAVNVPIIGIGGISTAEDVVEFMMAGANAVAVGTAIFSDPSCLVRIVDGLDAWLDRHDIADVNDIVGVMQA
jgi:dihydroorotate dehydrogenase (NAD+) catalytic subunit